MTPIAKSWTTQPERATNILVQYNVGLANGAIWLEIDELPISLRTRRGFDRSYSRHGFQRARGIGADVGADRRKFRRR